MLKFLKVSASGRSLLFTNGDREIVKTVKVGELQLEVKQKNPDFELFRFSPSGENSEKIFDFFKDAGEAHPDTDFSTNENPTGLKLVVVKSSLNQDGLPELVIG